MSDPGDHHRPPPGPAPYNPYGPPPVGGAGAPTPAHPYGPPPGVAPEPPAGGSGPAPGDGARPPFPGTGWFLLLVGIGFLVNTIGSAVALYSLAVAYSANVKDLLTGAVLSAVPPAALFGVLLVASLVWPAVALVAARLGRLSFREAFRWRRAGVGSGLLAALLGGALVPVALTLEHAMSRMAPRGENLLMQMMAQNPGPLALTLLGITLVVAAPVGEELLFRGLSLRGMERRYGLWPAAWIISVVFASIHLNLTGLPALFLVSLVLCWVTSRSGSLRPAILAHAAYNGVQFGMLAASDPDPESVKQALSSPAWPMPAWLVAAAVALTAACVVGLAALARRRRSDGDGADNADNTDNTDSADSADNADNADNTEARGT